MALKSVKLQKAQEASVIADEPAVLSLASYVRRCYEEAKTAKSDVTERLLRAERQRRGMYDPDKLAMIRETGGSDIYMMLTDIKCRAAESWIKDVILSTGEKSWSLSPTAEPTVPEDLRNEIIEAVTMEADAVQSAGIGVNPQTIEKRMEEIHAEVKKRLLERAKMASSKMEKRILDKMQDANFNGMLSEVIYDFVTFPAAFMKGPMIRTKNVLKWGPNWQPKVVEEIVEDFERVSPYDIFPSPNATTCQDGYLIHRHQMTRADFDVLRNTPSFNTEAVDEVMRVYGRSGLRELVQSDTERNLLEGRNNTLIGTELIESVEFWGSVSGYMLREWGMKDVEDYREYEVNVWLVGSYVIKCVKNPDPLARRPYSKASWESIPGAFWGLALPEMMTDIQTVCNAAARALANNMGIASGPQVEVSVDRLPDGEDLTKIYPWKIWQTTSDRTGGGQPAVRFYQPSMNADALLAVYQYFQRIADEVTGVPNYIYGSGQASGAGRTASGLSMLMENAAKGIKQAILSLDAATTDVIHRLYDHLMIYDDDQEIKGDMQIVPAGVVGTLLKESVQQRRNEFLQMTANPVDIQIMGPNGRAMLLREAAKTLNMDVDKIIPDPEKVMEVQQAMMEQMSQAQQQAPAQPPEQLPPEGMMQ
jgi:hypothetical protein